MAPALLPENDTEETKNAREAKRCEYLEHVARDWAGSGYEDMEIMNLWLAG